MNEEVLTKICVDCGVEKTLDNFAKAIRNKYGRRNYCKPCDHARKKEWRKNNLDKVRKTYNAWRGRNKEQRRLYERLRRAGSSIDEYIEIVKLQAGLCAICGVEEELVIDHDHVTNKLRGLLCRNCNSGIGLLKDSQIVLQKAIEYLGGNT